MIYCCLPGTSFLCISLSSSHWPIPFHLEQLCNCITVPQSLIFLSVLHLLPVSGFFLLFLYLPLSSQRDLCSNWDLALKHLKSACHTNKFVTFYSSSLNLNHMQYFAKTSFSFYIQSDHPAFLWLPSLALRLQDNSPAPSCLWTSTTTWDRDHSLRALNPLVWNSPYVPSESWASSDLVLYHMKDMPKSHQSQNKNLVLVTYTFCQPFSFTSRAHRTKLVCTPPWLHYSCTFIIPFPPSTEAQ